uniref:Uncharacterized protein n=1 Tax=Salix viminalis TaxID=40686 RepID=A0A6N2LCB7_SALVM
MSGIAHAQQGLVENAQRPNIYSKIFGSLFAFSANSPATTSAVTGSSFWEKEITMFSRVQASIFPPHLEWFNLSSSLQCWDCSFRWSDEAVGRGGGTGTGEKMKEGAAKSVEKGKAAVEDSARSAAKVASETVQKIKEKRSHRTETEPQDEL